MRGEVMGLVSQEPSLFATTIKENIRYGKPGASDEEVIEAAQKANAHEFILDFPKGYETEVGDRGHAISVLFESNISVGWSEAKNRHREGIAEEPEDPNFGRGHIGSSH